MRGGRARERNSRARASKPIGHSAMLNLIGEMPTQHAMVGGAIVVFAVFGQAIHGLLKRSVAVAKPVPAE